MNEPDTGLRRRTLLQAAGLSAAAGFALRGTANAEPGAAAGSLVTLSTPAAAAEQRAGNGFAHPGILHARADLDRMRDAVTAQRQPIYAGFQALAGHSRSSFAYTPRNTGQITSWGRGPTNRMNETADDAAAAYQNALMWCVTGDRRHADKARDILNAWSASLTAITGADGQLGTSLQGFKFVNAAELLRHSGYDGWAPAEIERCADSFRRVWYRSLSGFALFANGNWDAAAAQTAVAVAVFCDDRVMFENVVRYAVAGAGNGSVVHRIVTASGQGQESGRDQAHEQLGLAMIANVAQVAWNQGVDLFSVLGHRILANYEYNARYNLGKDDLPFVPDLDRTGKYLKTAISDKVRGTLQPIYELGYAHYVTRLGLTAPNTEQAIFRGAAGARVIEGANDDEPGWGTLTCARPVTAPRAPEAPPGVPSGLAARDGDGGTVVSWLGSVEPDSGAGARMYTVRRARHPRGPYLTLAAGLSWPEFTDRTGQRGWTYYYTVSASNSAGDSAESEVLASTAGLPRGWSSVDVGEARPAGRTTFDGERFVLEAGGVDLGGNRDEFRFTFLRLSGDGVITARLVFPLSSQYAKVGVMMRGSLAADAPHTAMLIQGLPLHVWSGVWTTRAEAGGRTLATGSTPVPPSQQEAITTGAGFPISNLGSLPESATPLSAPYVEGAGDGYRLRMPYWVRLSRKGNRFTGAISPNGREWTEVGSTEVALGRELFVGLVNCSCLGGSQGYAETGTAAFDNVTASGWSVPAPATVASGLGARTGVSAIELGWSDQDPAARYTVKRADRKWGPYQVIATGVGPVGFGVRTSYVDATGSPGRTYHYLVAKTNVAGEGPPSEVVSAAMPMPPTPVLNGATEVYATIGAPFSHLVRATNDATRFSARELPPGLSIDRGTGLISGVPSSLGEYTVRLSAANAAGAADGTLRLGVGVAPPAPWSSADIGDHVVDERHLGTYGVVALGAGGSTGYDERTRTFTVRGAGTSLNVNGQGMAAHFAYQRVSGDRTLVARISRRDGTSTAGVLMAKSLSPFDQTAGAVLTGAGSAQFVRRRIVAGGAATTAGTAYPWLKLERRGRTFTASGSPDGKVWTVLGQDDIATFGDAPYYVGLVVCSGDTRTLGAADFDDVTVTHEL